MEGRRGVGEPAHDCLEREHRCDPARDFRADPLHPSKIRRRSEGPVSIARLDDPPGKRRADPREAFKIASLRGVDSQKSFFRDAGGRAPKGRVIYVGPCRVGRDTFPGTPQGRIGRSIKGPGFRGDRDEKGIASPLRWDSARREKTNSEPEEDQAADRQDRSSFIRSE
jgi:hypothetical protein